MNRTENSQKRKDQPKHTTSVLRTSSPAPSQTDAAVKRALGLFRVTSHLLHAATKEDVGKIIINEAFSVLGAFNGDIVLQNKNGSLSVIAYKGYPERLARRWIEFQPDTPLLTSVAIQTKRPIFLKSVTDIDSEYASARTFFVKSRAKSAALLPLIFERNVLGVMQFTFKTPQAFNREDRLFMQTIANQCAIAFERVRAQEELSLSNDQLAVILKNTADGIVVQNEQGKITFMNARSTRIFDITPKDRDFPLQSELLLKRLAIHSEEGTSVDVLALAYGALQKQQKEFRSVINIAYKDGSERWFIVRATKVKMQPLFITTIHDITREKELDVRKDNFISIASHELKTPITSQRLFLELLSTRLAKTSDEKSLEYVRRISEQTGKLQKLIADLLDVSRIQKGKLQFSLEMLRLDELLKNTVQDLRLSTVSHQLVIKNLKPVTISGDSFRLYQVFSNLLTNAIKYSPGRKKVIISMRRAENTVSFLFQDFGIGISPDQQQRIFEGFYQGTNSQMKTSSGLGIGLFISQEIIKYHGGSIQVESKVGRGTTFTITLPIAKLK